MGEGDELGLAVARVWLGNDYRDNNPGFETAETAIELTYSKVLTEQIRVQPGLQYIRHPSSEEDLNDAIVFSLLVEITF
jgi:porin